MHLRFLAPIKENPKPTSRDQVLSLLSHEWPLTPKQIHHALTRQNGFDGTYQAVHKTLQQLETEGMLEKTDKQYQLSFSWIRQTQTALQAIEKQYLDKISHHEHTLTFHSIYETDVFLINLVYTKTDYTKNNGVMALQWNHFWVPFMLAYPEYQKIEKFFLKYDVHSTTNADTPLDRWCHKFWQRLHIKTQYGAPYSSNHGLLVFQDYVAHVFYPDEFIRQMDDFYTKTKKVSDANLDQLVELFHAPRTIPVTINQNKALADQLKQQILSYYK
ncbi:MAG: hypothetical protein Q7R47_04155 [Candidatus Diapherotrites archaeon]|nr:hypothetical protein [Candidatus Diapherotrites archaeon]